MWCKFCLPKRAGVDLQGNEGETALSLASQRGRLEIVNTLLANGTDVNLPDQKGWTALMWASQEGHLDVVRALLAKKADVNAKSKNGVTALPHGPDNRTS